MMYSFNSDLQEDSFRNYFWFLMGQDYRLVHDIQGLDSVVLDIVKEKVVARM